MAHGCFGAGLRKPTPSPNKAVRWGLQTLVRLKLESQGRRAFSHHHRLKLTLGQDVRANLARS